MKKQTLLFAVAVVALAALLPATSRAEDFVYAKRLALGLQGGSIGFGPTIEYWPSDNLALSAKVGTIFYYTSLGLRGTYLFNNRINIISWPARPYAGAGLGYQMWNVVGYTGFGGVGAEIFGGLVQPLSQNWTLRGELQASYYAITYPGGYVGATAFPLGIDLGIFYHFGGPK
jgi:hypothetical protein